MIAKERRKAERQRLKVLAIEKGKRLRTLRTELGLTQSDVVGRSGIARSEVSKLELGYPMHGGNHDVLMAVARGLGLLVEHLDAYLAGSLGLAAVVHARTGQPASPS